MRTTSATHGSQMPAALSNRVYVRTFGSWSDSINVYVSEKSGILPKMLSPCATNCCLTIPTSAPRSIVTVLPWLCSTGPCRPVSTVTIPV